MMHGGAGTRRRVLYVLHNHPTNRPGGAEVYAHELYRAVRDGGEFEPILVAKVGPPFSDDRPREGTGFGLIGQDPNEYFVYTDGGAFDRLFGTQHEKRFYTEEWPAFLRAVRPDVVHFQHTLYLGYDILRATRTALPSAAIVYTLHEFLPICNHSGQMVRTATNELCDHASPRRCHDCFPGVPTQTFFLRERFIKSMFEHVDMFITPSEHARRRYIEWGLPRARVRHEDYGRLPAPVLPDPADAGRRRRLAFIGQITPFKGVDVLLESMRILGGQEAGVELLLHGGTLQHQPSGFRERIHALLEQTAGSVQFHGPYLQSQLPGLLSDADWVVVPSIWPETGPLVIHEALAHNRPVICSDIGAMLERIEDGVNGLHFRTGDPVSLAATIRRAVTTPDLWPAMRQRLGDPHPMDEHLRAISHIYNDLLGHVAHPSAA
jgi:glycosyltransferase involved in cell wall biosynthesis